MSADGKDPAKRPDPFQLEPEAVAARPIPPLPMDTPATRAVLEGPPSVAKVVGKDGEERLISTKTLRERKDPSVRTRPGPVPLPRGWPSEALSYPVRDRLPFLVVVGSWVAVDTLGALNTFLGWVLGLLAYAFAARWQLRAVARSATGDDGVPDPSAVPTEEVLGGAPSADLGGPPPLGPREEIAFARFPAGQAPRKPARRAAPAGPRFAAVTESSTPAQSLSERLRRPLLFLLYLVPAAIPFLAPYLRAPSHPVRTGGETALMFAALAAALIVMAPAFLLAAAFDDRAVEKPWNAARWFLRSPLAFVAVAASWALALYASVVVGWASSSVVATVFASAGVRGASVYALLLAARLLGVLGRRYEP